MKIKSQIKLALVGLLLLITNFQLSTTFAQGQLTPPGAPAATMKTLDQIYAKLDARIPITNSTTAVTISQPGSYYLTTNLITPPGVAITISTNNVTLDLNGYYIGTSGLGAAGTAVLLNNFVRNIAIKDGFIQSGVTNHNGTYGGVGFNYGIFCNNPTNVTVSHVIITGVLVDGIYLNTGNATLVEDCQVTTAGTYGIYASTIKNSIAMDCGNSAIYGDLVSDCRGICTGTGYGVAATTVMNSYGWCSGNIGLWANTAQNCYGQSAAAAAGVYAINAQNCTGFSNTGDGIYADTALNCYGYANNGTSSGDGIYAYYLAQNCYGFSYNGYGILANYVAIGCMSTSTFGTGLYTTIGNSCMATSPSGTTENVTYKYNMP
jgi:hypothetical protein